MPPGISLHKNSSKRKKKHPKRRKSSKKKGFITEPVREENPRDEATDSSQQESERSFEPQVSVFESDSSDSDSGEGPAFTSVERHVVRKRLPKHRPIKGKKKSKHEDEDVQQLEAQLQKAIRKQEVTKRDRETIEEFFDEYEKILESPDLMQPNVDLEGSSHESQRPNDRDEDSNDQTASGSREVGNDGRKRRTKSSVQENLPEDTDSSNQIGTTANERTPLLSGHQQNYGGDDHPLGVIDETEEQEVQQILRLRANSFTADLDPELMRRFGIQQRDIDQYKNRMEELRNGINWETASKWFKSDPDFEEIFEDRMKRPVDSPEEGEGRLKRLGAMVKKELKGRNLGLSAIGIIPLVNIIKSLSDRGSEKDRKRVTKGILNFSNDETAKKMAKPLYAGHRKLQTEQTVITGANTASLVPLALSTANVVPTSLASLVKGPAAKLGVKAASALTKTLINLGIRKGVTTAEASITDHDPKGNERTKVLLEFLGMKSRMNLLEENPDLVTKLGKEQVMNELLRLQIRKSLGMTDDNQDLLDREPGSKQRKHIGRIPKLGKKLEKDEYLKDADLDAYRQLKKLKNSKPRSEQSDDDTDNPNQEPDLSEVNRLALMFKAEGLFKDGSNRLRKTKGFRRLLEEKTKIETDEKKYKRKEDAIKKEISDNTQDRIIKELIGPDLEKMSKHRVATQQLKRLRGEPKRLLDTELKNHPKARIKTEEKEIKRLKKEIQEIQGGSKRFWNRSNRSARLADASLANIASLREEIEASEARITSIKEKATNEKNEHSYPSSKGNNFTRMFKT